MNFKRASLIALAIAAGPACSGKLNVGNGAASEAGSAGSAGSTGSAGSAGISGIAGGIAGAGAGDAAATAGRAGAAAGSAGAVSGGSGGTAGTSSSAGSAGMFCPDFMFPCNFGGNTQEQIDMWESYPRVSAAPGSTSDCPQGPLTPGSTCSAPGQICAYRFDGDKATEQCACAASTVSDTASWRCQSDFEDTVNICPLEKPKNGSDCYGFYNWGCSYPWQIECECSADSKVWSCMDPPSTPADAPRAQLSDPKKPVADLSDTDLASLCDWSASVYGPTDGFPPIQDYPVDDDGYLMNVGCAVGDKDFCPASAPQLSKAQCLANLKLSTCKAPVQLLADCARSVYFTCSPADTACAEYLRTPNCAGTMIGVGLSTSACKLRVE